MSDAPEQKIDENINLILEASGSKLKYYTMESTLRNMRAAMRQIMSESYIQGSNDATKIFEELNLS